MRTVGAGFDSVVLGTPVPVLCSVILDAAAVVGLCSVVFGAAAGLCSVPFVVAVAADDGLAFGVTLDRVVPVAAAAAAGFLVVEGVAADGEGLVETFGEAAADDGLVDAFGEAVDGKIESNLDAVADAVA